ncbi:phytanoyl-CoA dioxygenase family protein [Bradyrhizobium sp. Ai1a-2]|uniref:phytanoyl-CoA dioxygenase family protein n=1 Tax=Bradyrhizobium sp. Ai1a-2 TaxID=196490 RepID=UPI0004826802|nr:phytanoyl-CoA dioxygenase family protein [Bradyrhizobium sp. Ai1a-2]
MSSEWSSIVSTLAEDDSSNGALKTPHKQSDGPLRYAYIAAYNKIVAAERRQLDDGKDESGFGDRIGQLHQKHPELLELARNERVTAFLRWAFDDDPIVFGSLNFERGTTQEAHIDAIFFWPEPSYSMAGCWVALEDIHPDSGPLFYVPASHTWPFYRSDDIVKARPALDQQRTAARSLDFPADKRSKVVAELGHTWTEDFRALERSYRSERPALNLRAGDVVFWHSLLAHGGSPRINPKLSRRSAVFHFVGKRTLLYTFEQFMLYDREEVQSQPPQKFDLQSYKGLKYIRYPYFTTYNGARETVHQLDAGADISKAASPAPSAWRKTVARLLGR